MSVDELTPRDQLAASLSGMLAEGMGSQPVKMAEMLLDDGWTLAPKGSSDRDEQVSRIIEALDTVQPDLDLEKEARALWRMGVRVLGPDEVILSRADAKLLDHVRQAAQRWEEKKQEARVQPDQLKEALLLAALIGAGKPLARTETIQAAAGWHADYPYSETEWKLWHAAWRRLIAQGRIHRTNSDRPAEFALWEFVPIEEVAPRG